MHPVFHVSLLEPYQTSIRPARERAHMQPVEINSDLEWQVEKPLRVK